MNQYRVSGNFPATAVENEFVLISLNLSESLLLLEWKRQISLAERQAGFLQALELTHQNGIKYWLISDLNIFFISPEEKRWILTDWIELASNSSILKLAVVVLEDYNVLMNSTDFTSRGQQQYQENGVIEHQVFMDFTSARTWLLFKDEPLNERSLV
ncbi:hypothetical protein AAE02nite_16710 [Adhaeribacter aerolatus]|uniref:STAS/SEC14 domain-containing protein n=1 Tax=Adhaeribacter aerolatus TaxID=670289 RepID=A0A512AWX3_9BACT|nr:hypothetical protein [Adhaeribacter aerolatus]GEO04007.1 hypothetical protein AAE02nite_16710 [Adhaeribacter aerolatus]